MAPTHVYVVCGEQAKRLAVWSENNPEMPLVKGQYILTSVAFGEHDNRSARQTLVEVSIALHVLSGGADIYGIERHKVVGATRYFIQHGLRDLLTSTHRGQIIDFGQGKGGQDTTLRNRQHTHHTDMVSVVTIIASKQAGRVEHYNPWPKPSNESSTRSERLAFPPLKTPNHGAGGIHRSTMSRTPSRMISASKSPDSAATRSNFMVNSPERQTVVLFIAIYHR